MPTIDDALDWLEKNTITIDAESHQIKISYIATLRAELTPKPKPSRGEHCTSEAFATAQELINNGKTYDETVAQLNANYDGNFTRSQLSYWLYKGALKSKFRKVYRKVGA